MKLFQSTVEKIMYSTLLIVFVAAFVSVAINYDVIHQLKAQQSQFHDQNINSQETIITNQINQTQAIKDYIACLLTLKPGPTLQAQEKACFDKAPDIQP